MHIEQEPEVMLQDHIYSDNEPDEPDFVVGEEHVPDGHSDSDSSDNEEDHFDFSHHSLDRILEFSQVRTVRESILLTLALSVRHRQDYECLINTFKSKNVLLGRKFFPTSKTELWKILGRNSSGVEAHVFCSSCSLYIDKKKRLGPLIVCPSCKVSVKKEDALFFITISLKLQLLHFLSLPEISEHLKYRERRTKRQEGAIEDMFDGEGYLSIEVDGEKLMNSKNYTFTLNTDGCKIRKGAKTSIYPVFVRLNELPPKLRQKHMFLVGVYVGIKEPNMQCFLKPIVAELNNLSTEGVLWKPDGVTEVRSKFIPMCYYVDGKARWQILNMSPHTSHWACTQCTYYGVSINNYMRYPTQHNELPAYEMRTNNGMKADMAAAEHPGNVSRTPVRGHKGATPLVLLKHMDLVKGGGFDDLHYFYECASYHHTQLILKEAPRIPPTMGHDSLCDLIDDRMKMIKTPSCISRKPGNCKMKNMGQMSGTELRNWLLYAAIPCLQNLVQNTYIQHLERVSHAAYLLSLDIINHEDINKAERYIKEYLHQYQTFFGAERTRLNLHSLEHAPGSVRFLGAVWNYSTFNFESWNHKIMQLVTSAKGVLSQIVTRHLIHMSLERALMADNNIAPDVKEQIRKILNKRRREDGLEVAPHTYLLGTCTVKQPTREELDCLEQEGLHPSANLKVYNKVSIRSVDYRTSRTHQEDFKSDDTSVFTYVNTFCTILDIVTFEDRNGSEVCGLFVMEHDVVRPAPFTYATHICEIKPETHDIFHFYRVTEVRSPVVKVYVDNHRYFIPLPNTTEID